MVELANKAATYDHKHDDENRGCVEAVSLTDRRVEEEEM